MTYIGEIRAFPYNFRPSMEVEWLVCDGMLHNIREYQALYSVIGVRYGGDANSVFKVPDLRSRLAAGMGVQPETQTERMLGAQWGTDSVTLKVENMPAHTHALTGAFTAAAADLSGEPAGTYKLSRTFNQLDYLKDDVPDVRLSPHIISFEGGAWVDKNQVTVAHENRQPVLALAYFICSRGGKYPMRDY